MASQGVQRVGARKARATRSLVSRACAPQLEEVPGLADRPPAVEIDLDRVGRNGAAVLRVYALESDGRRVHHSCRSLDLVPMRVCWLHSDRKHGDPVRHHSCQCSDQKSGGVGLT
eukprot:2550473-Rhodomonas_salina.2